MKPSEKIADDVWIRRYPLSLAGCQFGRNVSIIRLLSGKVLIHSTAAFSEGDARSIREIGEPAWLLEATNFHDTQSAKGLAVFPDIPYFTPTGFKAKRGVSTQSISRPPKEWCDEIEIIEVGGMPSIREHLLFHRPSKTLIVADLLFNLPESSSRWTRLFMRWASGMRRYPAMSRFFRFFIKDRDAFAASLQHAAELEFDHLIVGHGDPVRDEGKRVFVDTIRQYGFDI